MANLVLAVLLCGACFFAFPAKSSEYSLRKEAAFAKKYLRTFYDFNIQQSRVSRRQYNNVFSRKLREMQRFFGLKETGKLDPATLEVMHQPRCGVSDMGESKSSNAIKLWGKDKLTYSFENYTPDLPKDLVEDAINRAFQEWSKHIPLTFKQSSSKADIMISFFTKEHLSCSAFDGPGNTLAHAYSPGPGIGGDVHFDEDEKWAVVTEGVNLTVVAAHEFGHALGLPHSSDINALMYPNYENKPTDLLSTDDIQKIKAFYPAQRKKGKLFREPNALENSDESGEPEEPEEPSRCPPGPSFDAVATLGGETLFFKDDYVWRQITLDMPPEHYPINRLWSTLPSNIEAAYEYSTTTYNIFFFKGTKFWVTEGFKVISDSPKDISQLGFPKSVKNIDAAVHDENTGKTFFFVKSQYWSYDEENKRMDAGFPKPIASGFPGIGVPVHSAFQKNGFLFFFDSQNLYQFDNKKKRVVNTSGENKWLKC